MFETPLWDTLKVLLRIKGLIKTESEIDQRNFRTADGCFIRTADSKFFNVKEEEIANG